MNQRMTQRSLRFGSLGRRRGGASPGLLAAVLLVGLAVVGVGVFVVTLATRQPAPSPQRSQDAALGTLEAVENSIATLAREEKWDEAVAVAKAAVESYPEDRELRLRYAELLQRVEDAAGAHDQYAAALEIGPRDAATEYLAGLSANKAGRTDRAIDHFQRARAADPNRVEYTLHLGLAQFNAGREDAARASFVVVTRMNPDNALAWGMLAQIALRSGDRGSAIEFIETARELDPSSVVWRVVEADALVMRDADRAAELLSRIPADELPVPYGLNVARKVFGVTGRFADAARFHAHASDAAPGDAALAIETADLFDRAGNREEAIRYARRAQAAGDEGAARMLARLEDGG